MSAILERIVNSETDRRLVLSNGLAVRRMQMGADWTEILLGVRWSFTAAANITGDPRFFVGVAATAGDPDTAGVWGDASVDHALGARPSVATLSITTTGSGKRVISNGTSNGGTVAVKRIGTTDTSASLQVVQGHRYGPADTSIATHRGAFFLQIIKGSPNYTLRASVDNETVDVPDITATQFLTALEAGIDNVGSVISGFAATAGSALIAVDEGADGAFDAVNLAWNKASSLLEISDVAVSRVS